jgi:hypothetical protein
MPHSYRNMRHITVLQMFTIGSILALELQNIISNTYLNIIFPHAVNSQLRSIQAPRILIQPAKISKKFYNFYSYSETYLHVHTFTCQRVVLPAATSSTESCPPPCRCHDSTVYLNLWLQYRIYIQKLWPISLIYRVARPPYESLGKNLLFWLCTGFL